MGHRKTAVPVLLSALVALLIAVGVDAKGKEAASAPQPLVGAYYFSWYNLEDQWSKYPRSHEPKLGEYDQGDAKVVQQHHAWAKRGGIDFFAMAWSGAGSKHVEWERADMIDKRVIAHLDAGQESGVRSALMYNIRDVVAAGKNGLIDLAEKNNCAIFRDHMMHAATTHFMHPSYLTVAGSPVLFLYTLRDYINHKDCLLLTFQGMKEEFGMYPYIIADSVWWTPAADRMDWGTLQALNVSAVTAFNTFDAGQRMKMAKSFSYFSSQLFHEVASPAWLSRITVIPTVMPGFDDRRLRGEGRPAVQRAGGAEFVTQWKQMLWFSVCQPLLRRALPRPGGSMDVPPVVMVNSFNEWHDGTAIEPSAEFGDQYIKLLASLKQEVSQEDLQCVKGKDVHYKAPKYIVPPFLRAGAERTPGDDTFIRGISVVVWCFCMWLTWTVLGTRLLALTGANGAKIKDDDLNFNGFNPSLPASRSQRARGPGRVFTPQTWAVVLGVGAVSYLVIAGFLALPPVRRLFSSRRAMYDHKVHYQMRAAREHAAKLCPDMKHLLHQAKFEEWVQKMAMNQISPKEFKQEMCGRSPKHFEEVEALYLEFLGRLPEEKGLEHYVKNLEAGEMTLEEVKKAVANSPEASEWAQQRQQERSKSPVRRMMRGVLESMKAAQDGQLLGDRGAQLGALESIEQRVRELEAQGKPQEAAKLIQSFFRASQKEGASGKIHMDGARDSMVA